VTEPSFAPRDEPVSPSPARARTGQRGILAGSE